MVWGPTLINMMIEHLGYLEAIQDERANAEFASNAFECGDVRCPEFYNRYRHLFNIDPEYLHISISVKLANKMIDDGMVCDK